VHAETSWYFGYGSNMSPAIFCGRRGMHPLASRWGWLDDHALRFDLPVGPGERGVANVVPVAGARTCGVLYLLASEECGRLDRTEGVHLGFYRRAPVQVLADGRELVAAFTYRSTFSDPRRKPSARYLGLLLDGARHHGLPAEYVSALERHELAWDERQPAADSAKSIVP
jgi:cation transport regulator ChaC